MWIIVVLIALVAPARADATWDQVAALAKPTAKRGSSKQLAAAMALAEKNDRAWSDNRYKHVGLDAYPEGKPALAALVAWRKENGGLPAETSPIERGRRAFRMMRLGQLAVDTADVEHRANLEVAMYLATVMIEDGDNFLVEMTATSIVDDAKRKAKELIVATDTWPTPKASFVRVFAAEALSQNTTMLWVKTPAGKKAVDESLKQMDPKTKQAAEAVTGVPLVMPSDAEWAKLNAFFLKSLDGAKRDEPADATLARIHAAVNGDRMNELIESMAIRVSAKL